MTRAQKKMLAALLASMPHLTFNERLGVIVAVLGAQTGDEGKGKVVTFLIEHCGCTLVVRFQGGCNAGHTLWVNGEKVVLHHLPEGVAFDGVLSAIGAGCVINPDKFVEEVAHLDEAGITLSPYKLVIDGDATVTTIWHIEEDSRREDGPHSMGTTRRGIAPTATSITKKLRLTVDELLDATDDYKRLRAAIYAIAADYGRTFRSDAISIEAEIERLIRFAGQLRGWCRLERVDNLVYEHQQAGHHTVLVGGQGAHLDPLRSHKGTSLSIWPPLALGTLRNMAVLGVIKQVATALGEHPLPTKILFEEHAEQLRELGNEYGATTQRPRDVCHLFTPMVNASIMQLGLDGLVVTKADLHTGRLDMWTSLLVDGCPVDWWASSSVAYDRASANKCTTRVLAAGQVVLLPLSGRIKGIRRWESLPQSLRDRMGLIESHLIRGTRVVMIGNGPNPEDIVVRGT